MLASKDKISTRQAIIIFLTLMYSPAIRLFPVLTSKIVGRAGWLAPIFVLLPYIILVFIMSCFFKDKKNQNLSDVYMNILGKIIGRFVLLVYFLWINILLGLYVRYFAERFSISLNPNSPMNFYIITILIIVFFALRGGLVPFTRTTEFFFTLFTVIFILVFLLDLTNVEIINLFPVTYYEIIPLIKSSYSILGIWVYFAFIFFFADKINDLEHIKRFGMQSTVYLFATATMILIQTIGVYGFSIIRRISLPYISVVKSVTILETIERIESIVTAFWVIIDFVIISAFAYIAISILKSIFSLSDTKSLVSPIILFAFIFSNYIARNVFELSNFSNHIGLQMNIFLGFIVPVLVFLIGKIRRKI